jgi:hypothetical protein
MTKNSIFEISKKSNSGQSLFEVVFALAVAGIVMIGIVSLAASSVRNSSYSRNNALATRYVQETSEWLRGQRDGSDWTSFSGYADASGVTYCLQSLGSSLPSVSSCGDTDYITGTIFIRELKLTLLSADTVDVEISVEWNDAQGLHTTRSLTQLTNWQTP